MKKKNFTVTFDKFYASLRKKFFVIKILEI